MALRLKNIAEKERSVKSRGGVHLANDKVNHPFWYDNDFLNGFSCDPFLDKGVVFGLLADFFLDSSRGKVAGESYFSAFFPIDGEGVYVFFLGDLFGIEGWHRRVEDAFVVS